MDKADIPFLSAADLSRLIQGKEVSPVDAAEAYLEKKPWQQPGRRSGPSPEGTTWDPCTDSPWP